MHVLRVDGQRLRRILANTATVRLECELVLRMKTTTMSIDFIAMKHTRDKDVEALQAGIEYPAPCTSHTVLLGIMCARHHSLSRVWNDMLFMV